MKWLFGSKLWAQHGRISLGVLHVLDARVRVEVLFGGKLWAQNGRIGGACCNLLVAKVLVEVVV